MSNRHPLNTGHGAPRPCPFNGLGRSARHRRNWADGATARKTRQRRERSVEASALRAALRHEAKQPSDSEALHTCPKQRAHLALAPAMRFRCRAWCRRCAASTALACRLRAGGAIDTNGIPAPAGLTVRMKANVADAVNPQAVVIADTVADTSSGIMRSWTRKYLRDDGAM